VLDPVAGGSCRNTGPDTSPGSTPSAPPGTPRTGTNPTPASALPKIGVRSGTGSPGELASTGSGALAAAPLAAGLIGGGLVLRRRFPGRNR
jgi:hypothetical protein